MIEALQVFSDLVDHIDTGWNRTAMSSIGVTVPDPGHGLDRISPISLAGDSFDSANAALTGPFSSAQVVEQTGYVELSLMPGSGPDLLIPGEFPEYEIEPILVARIFVPHGCGPGLAFTYSGALHQYLNLYDSYAPGSLIRTFVVDPAVGIPVLFDDSEPFDIYKSNLRLYLQYTARMYS